MERRTLLQPDRIKASRRQPEFDALRGFLLIWMTLNHLPTHASYFTNQPLGFVSAAEGFIFLSALLTGRVFGRVEEASGFRESFKRLWSRAVRLYGYHVFLLTIAFTVVASIAIHTKQPSLQGLLDFYLAHRVLAICSSLLLVYCPPLLDILPMYIIFLFATPFALYAGRRWGWKVVLIPTCMLWILAQFGLRAGLHDQIARLTGLRIPLNEMGAFDMFAWQFLWALGLWVGCGLSERLFQRITSKTAVLAALLLAGILFLARHAMGPVPNSPRWAGLTDKWSLGLIRMLNFASLAVLFAVARPREWILFPPLVSLGKASLEVFCAHLLFCFAALALVGDGANLPVWAQVALIATTLLGLYVVARCSERFLKALPERSPKRI